MPLLHNLSDMKGVIMLLATSFSMPSYAQRWSHSLKNSHLILAADEWMHYFGFVTERDVTEDPYKGVMTHGYHAKVVDHFRVIEI